MRRLLSVLFAFLCFACPMLACGQSTERVNTSEPVDMAYEWLDGSAFRTLVADTFQSGPTGLAELQVLSDVLADLSDVLAAPNSTIANIRLWRDTVLSRQGLTEGAFRVISIFNNIILAIETGSKPRDKLSSGNTFHLATLIERIRSYLSPMLGTT